MSGTPSMTPPSPHGESESSDRGVAQDATTDGAYPPVSPPIDRTEPWQAATEHERRHDRNTRRPERSALLLELMMAVALEALPVTTWLFVLAGINGAPGVVALPFWWILVVLLGAWGVATLLRRVPRSGRWHGVTDLSVKLLAIVGWLFTVLISLVLSPSAYFGMPLYELVAAFTRDVVSGSGRLGADVGLAFLAAYLWWRGVLLGRLSLTRDRLYVRFLWGLAAMVLAIVAAATLRGNTRIPVATALALLLPAQVFVGLVGIALAQLLDAEEEHGQRRQQFKQAQSRSPRSAITRAWLVSALGISAGMVLGALVLALIVSYDSVRGLAGVLQPLANALGTLIGWLIEALAFLLFLLLNAPLTWIKAHLLSSSKPTTNPPQVTHSGTSSHTTHPLPHAWLVAGLWVLIALALVSLALVLLLALRRFREWRQQTDYEEERETMDAAATLGKQLRGLLGALRGRKAAVSADVELLPEGSVRLLYRELLEHGVAAGCTRRPSETPDEYAERLRALAQQEAPHLSRMPGQPDLDQALAALTDAYDPARYRASPTSAGGEKAPPPIVAAQHAALAWLAARASSRERNPARTGVGTGNKRLKPLKWLPQQRQ